MNLFDHYALERRYFGRRRSVRNTLLETALDLLTRNMSGRRFYPRWYLRLRR